MTTINEEDVTNIIEKYLSELRERVDVIERRVDAIASGITTIMRGMEQVSPTDGNEVDSMSIHEFVYEFIEDYNLTTRIMNCFKSADFKTVGDVKRWLEKKHHIKNLGKKMERAIRDGIAEAEACAEKVE